jgi:hypothetical protein
MAEQLRLEQLGRYRRSVQSDERFGLTWAVLVQSARDQFLAGARLAGDEYRDTRTRQSTDRAEYLLHGRRPA